MEFIDRVSAYPNRYVMTDENGNTSYVYLERADEPTVVGTPLNAETFNKRMIESDEYPGCYYRMVDGETEWLNPPMAINVEYRTAERSNGFVVYTKYFPCGTLPAIGESKMFAHGIDISKVIRCEGTAGTAVLPYIGKLDAFSLAVNNTNIETYCEKAQDNPTSKIVYVTLWYTKK